MAIRMEGAGGTWSATLLPNFQLISYSRRSKPSGRNVVRG